MSQFYLCYTCIVFTFTIILQKPPLAMEAIVKTKWHRLTLKYPSKVCNSHRPKGSICFGLSLLCLCFPISDSSDCLIPPTSLKDWFHLLGAVKSWVNLRWCFLSLSLSLLEGWCLSSITLGFGWLCFGFDSFEPWFPFHTVYVSIYNFTAPNTLTFLT